MNFCSILPIQYYKKNCIVTLYIVRSAIPFTPSRHLFFFFAPKYTLIIIANISIQQQIKYFLMVKICIDVSLGHDSAWKNELYFDLSVLSVLKIRRGGLFLLRPRLHKLLQLISRAVINFLSPTCKFFQEYKKLAAPT